MKLIHISDTHIVPGPDTLYGLNPRERLAAAVADINRHHADAAACVITGDLTHWGEPAAYAALGEILAGLAVPPILLLGNHDNREAFQAVFPGAMRDEAGFVQGVFRMGGHALVCLDTNQPGTHAGHYCARRQAWLARTLVAIEEPVLLFMHHPPFHVGVSGMDAICLQDALAFADILAPHRHRIRHIFMGHLHLPISGSWQGIPFSVLAAQNHQLDHLASAAGAEIWGSDGDPRYAVVMAGPDSVMVHERAYLTRPRSYRLDADEGLGRAYALGMRA